MKVHLWKSGSAAGRQKTGQSIRGKISGPIPIPNPIDDEFPMRNPGTGIATPLPADGNEPQFPVLPAQQVEASSSSAAVPATQSIPAVPDARPEVAHNTKSTNSTHSRTRSGTGSASASGPSPTSGLPGTTGTNTSPRRRTNPSSTLRYSTVSGSSHRTGNTSNKDVPQRKKSTIRGALSKLFGRKKKSDGGHDSIEEGTIGSSQHRSDPTALNRLGKDGEPKRSASLPITEYDRALRSHSVGPGDITAIESARNSMHADFAFSRRRANTTTSHLYAIPRVRDGELAGLSPRPASTHGRGSRQLSSEDDPNEIGRAITSDSVGLRRRSRSLSGLPDVDTRGGARRRSDEIRYWRESYDPAFMSPMSSNAPDNDDTGVITMDMATEAASMDPPKTPPQPFNFGSIATMNEMAGMKITQAVSLDTRLGNLEARVRRMEKVITQLAHAVPGFRVRVQVEPPEGNREAERFTGPGGESAQLQGQWPAPAASEPSIAHTANTTSTAPLNPSLYQAAPPDVRPPTDYSASRQSEDGSHMSFGEAPTFIGSLHPSTAQGHASRPMSNSTVRGAASLPMLPREITGPFTADHYTTLLALIETERTQRQLLEAQVKKLSRALNVVSSQSAATVQLDPPPTARSFGGQSAFDHDSTDDDEAETTEDEGSKQGGPTRGKPLVAQDSGIAAGQEAEEDDYSEAFQTPREEQPHSFGAFGEELRDADASGRRKKAARTLSLSQLAVGRPQ